MAVDLNTIDLYPFCNGSSGQTSFLQNFWTRYIPYTQNAQGFCSIQENPVNYVTGDPINNIEPTQEIKLCLEDNCKVYLLVSGSWLALTFNSCARQYFRIIIWVYDPTGTLAPGTGLGGSSIYDTGTNYIIYGGNANFGGGWTVNYSDPNAFGIWTIRVTVSLCSDPAGPLNICDERFFDFLVTDGCDPEDTSCHRITFCPVDDITDPFNGESYLASNIPNLFNGKYAIVNVTLESTNETYARCIFIEKVESCEDVETLQEVLNDPNAYISEGVYDNCNCQGPCEVCPPGYDFIVASNTCERVIITDVIPGQTSVTTEICIPIVPVVSVLPNSNYNSKGALIYEEVLDKDLPLILTPQNVFPDSNLQCTNAEIPQPGPGYVTTNPGNYTSGFLPCPLTGNRHNNVNTAVPVIWPDTVVPGLVNSFQIAEFQKTVFRQSPIFNVPPTTKFLGQGAPLKALVAVLGPPWVQPGDSWMNRIGKTGKNGGLLTNTTQNVNYGFLYNWHALTNGVSGSDGRGTRGIVNINTTGNWRVPTDAQWDTLIGYIDPGFSPIPTIGSQSGTVGGILKIGGTADWFPSNVGATNGVGFTSLPGSVRNPPFGLPNISTYYWTSTENFGANGFYRGLSGGNASIDRGAAAKYTGMSVRIFRNASVTELLLTDGTWIYNAYQDNTGNYYNGVKIGTQVWITENLRDEFYNDGTPIVNIIDDPTWLADTTGAYCSYNNNPPIITSVSNIDMVVPEQQDNVWYGVTKVLISPDNRVTHLAISSDNSFRVFLNNNLLIEANVGDGIKPTFTFAHLFKLTLPAGTHIMKLETLNYSGDAGFAYQLLDAELPQILAVATESDLDNLSVFSSKNDDGFEIKDNTYRALTVFPCYTCPEGFEIIGQGTRQAYCLKVESIPAGPGCPPSPDNITPFEPELKVRCIEPGLKTDGCVPNDFTKKDCDTSCH